MRRQRQRSHRRSIHSRCLTLLRRTGENADRLVSAAAADLTDHPGALPQTEPATGVRRIILRASEASAKLREKLKELRPPTLDSTPDQGSLTKAASKPAASESFALSDMSAAENPVATLDLVGLTERPHDEDFVTEPVDGWAPAPDQNQSEVTTADPPALAQAPAELLEPEEAPSDGLLSDWRSADHIITVSEERAEIAAPTIPPVFASQTIAPLEEADTGDELRATPIEQDQKAETACDGLEVLEWHVMPLAMWAFQEDSSIDDLDTTDTTGRHALRILMDGLSLPLDVASVSYASGCQIHRVRVKRVKKKTRRQKGVRDPVVILPKKALREAPPNRARRPAKARRASVESLTGTPDDPVPTVEMGQHVETR